MSSALSSQPCQCILKYHPDPLILLSQNTSSLRPFTHASPLLTRSPTPPTALPTPGCVLKHLHYSFLPQPPFLLSLPPPPPAEGRRSVAHRNAVHRADPAPLPHSAACDARVAGHVTLQRPRRNDGCRHVCGLLNHLKSFFRLSFIFVLFDEGVIFFSGGYDEVWNVCFFIPPTPAHDSPPSTPLAPSPTLPVEAPPSVVQVISALCPCYSQQLPRWRHMPTACRSRSQHGLRV